MQTYLIIMWKDIPQVRISWDTMKLDSASAEVLADNVHIKVPNNLRVEHPKFQHVLDFLESRCAPRTRIGIEDILKAYGLREYNPMLMCKKSHGRSPTDYIWVKFEGDEDLTWDDIRIRD